MNNKQKHLNSYYIYNYMVMYKLRDGAYQRSGDSIKVLTVPNEISVFFDGTIFSVEKSGCSIIYTSGAKNTITKKQLTEYKYEDCRIK